MRTLFVIDAVKKVNLKSIYSFTLALAKSEYNVRVARTSSDADYLEGSYTAKIISHKILSVFASSSSRLEVNRVEKDNCPPYLLTLTQASATGIVSCSGYLRLG